MILDDCLLLCMGTRVGYVTIFVLKDQEKFDHSAADYSLT